MPDIEILNPEDKKDRMFISDVSIGVFVVATRRECGEAIQSVLCTDMEEETKLELISKYADAFTKGKTQYD